MSSVPVLLDALAAKQNKGSAIPPGGVTEGLIQPTHLPAIILNDFIIRYCDWPGSIPIASQA